MILRLLALVLILTAAAQAQTKRAFIVGIDAYEQLDRLDKAKGDAQGYRGFFEDDLGYETTYLPDPTLEEFLIAFEAFSNSIARGDQVVFIFSGHGWSDGAENFLLPRDAPAAASSLVMEQRSVALNKTVLAKLEAPQPALLLAIIDACRQNALNDGVRTSTRGLVPVNQKRGTMVVFSAGRNQLARDWLDSPDEASPYSVFTRVFLPKLRQTDRPLVEIVAETRDEVEALAARVNHPQRPADYSDISSRFCLSGTCLTPAMRAENAMWDRVTRDGGAEAYRGYLFAYPEGRFVREARAELDRLSVDVPDVSTRPPEPVQTITVTGTRTRQPGDVFSDCSDCPEMVVIPAGEFEMGSPPQPVQIGYQFAVGRYEVTWAEWEACVADGGCFGYAPNDEEDWGKGSRPVINVSWNDAQAYVAWLSRKTGEEYRLLSDAEWEYAARAGTTGRFSWGYNDPTCLRGARNGANFSSCSSDRTEPVGFSAPNSYGLYDLHGNVWEWVEDCHKPSSSYSGDGPPPPPLPTPLSADGCFRVLRGGSWNNAPHLLTVDSRVLGGATSRDNFIGFRVARTL